MNVIAKKSVFYKGSGSYSILLYGGTVICAWMKGIQGEGVLMQTIQKLVKDHFDCKMVDKFKKSAIARLA